MNLIEIKRTRRPRWLRAGLLALSLAVLGACEGENLFNPEENPFTTLNVTLSGASGGVAGDTLRFLVSGDAPTNLSRFDVTVRGAVNKDTSIAAFGRQATSTVRIVLPPVLLDTLLYLSVRAVDAVGNASRMVSDTFVVYAPPAFVSVTGGEGLAPGGTGTLRVRAVGIRPLSQMVLALGGAAVNNQTVTVNGTDVTRDFLLAIPAAPGDTLLQVNLTARDINGLTATKVLTLPIQVSGPNVTALSAPGIVSPGTSLEVQVAGAAMRGVSALKVQLSGAVNTESTINVSPASPTAARVFNFALPGNLTGSSIVVRAYAVDKGGMMSSEITSTVLLATGNPVVDSVSVPASVPQGGTLDVRVFARGPRPISSVSLRLRGGADNGASGDNQQISPASTTVVKDLSVAGITPLSSAPLTCGTSTCSTTANLTVFVTDQGGQVSAIFGPVTVVITNIPKPPPPPDPGS